MPCFRQVRQGFATRVSKATQLSPLKQAEVAEAPPFRVPTTAEAPDRLFGGLNTKPEHYIWCGSKNSTFSGKATPGANVTITSPAQVAWTDAKPR